MKILIAPNNFKGSLSASQFCKIAINIFTNAAALPIADGGDGILDVFAAAYPTAKKYKIKAQNAIGHKQFAPYLILPDAKTCIIETAKICGLGSLAKNQLDPLGATSYGIGQVIKAAIKKGAKTFYIGLGGVACNDGGAGMATALGFKFYDVNNNILPLGAAPLIKLTKIKSTHFKGIKFIGITDVSNPLLGKLGSAAVYGPQKGATPAQVMVLDAALSVLSRIVKSDLGLDINQPRCGAAGAIAAGVYGFLGGKLIDGGAFILKQIKAQAAVKKADIIITGEGQLDAQTFYGKAPAALCLLAKKYNKPVIFICGINDLKNTKILKTYNIQKVIALCDYAPNKYSCIKNPQPYLKAVLKIIKQKQH